MYSGKQDETHQHDTEDMRDSERKRNETATRKHEIQITSENKREPKLNTES